MVGVGSSIPSFLKIEKGIKLILALKSQSALVWNFSPILQETKKLPRSLSLGGSFYWSKAVVSSVRATASHSSSFLLFDNTSFKNLAYLGICSSISTKWRLMCKLLKIFKNLEICLSNFFFFNLWGKGIALEDD